MTQVQSLQQTKHYVRQQLIRLRKVVCSDEMEQAEKICGIDHYLTEIKEINESLKNAIAAESK